MVASGLRERAGKVKEEGITRQEISILVIEIGEIKA